MTVAYHERVRFRNVRCPTWPCLCGWARATLVVLALPAWAPSFASPLPTAAADALALAQRLAQQAQLAVPASEAARSSWSRAIEAGQDAVRRAPNHAAPRRFLAQAYGLIGEDDAAWDAWRAYLELGGSQDAQVRRQVAEVAERLGRRSLEAGEAREALPYLRTAAEHDEGLQPLLDRAEQQARAGSVAMNAFGAGMRALAEERYDVALMEFSAAAEADPEFVEAWRRAGETSLRLGRPAEAVTFLEHVIETGHGDDELRETLEAARAQAEVGRDAYSALERGERALEAGDREAARVAFLEAVEHAPTFAAAHAGLGRLDFAAEAYDRAVQRYRRAIELDPENDAYRTFLAQSERLRERVAAEAEARATADAAARAAAQEEAARLARAEETPADEAAVEQAPDANQPPPDDPPAEPEAPADAPADVPANPPADEPETPDADPQEAAVNPEAEEEVPQESLLLIDDTIEHVASDGSTSSAFTFLPANAAAPEVGRYLQGTLHQRLDVLSKPTDAPVRYQFCLVPDDIVVPPACGDPGALAFTGTGVVRTSQPLASLAGIDAVDWERGLESFLLIVRAPDGTPIDEQRLVAAEAESIDLTRYYPMRVRFQAVLTPPGAQPPDW